jgi:hypothetical protein
MSLLDTKLYFYDADDNENVGTVVEYHEIRKPRGNYDIWLVVLIGKKRIRVTDVGYHDYKCADYEDVSDQPLSKIRKGAIVHVDFMGFMDHGVLYEAEVLSASRSIFDREPMFLVRWRKLIKAKNKDHGFKGADDKYTQLVNISRLKIIKNGKGKRLVRCV